MTDQTILLATVSPGYAGDALSLTQTGETDGGTVTLVGDEVIYTAPLDVHVGVSDQVAYTIREQTGGTISATGTVTLDAGPALIETDTTVALAAPVSYGAGSTQYSVTTADLTDDGRSDIILADYGYGSDSGGVDVLLNQGGGSFAPAVSFSAGQSPLFVTTSDPTGDGRADIIVADVGQPRLDRHAAKRRLAMTSVTHQAGWCN